MFVDEKTLNRIHANLGESVSHATMRCQDLIPAFMNVLRDTSEYVQLMNSIPAYASNDKDSDWWDSEDAVSLLESLFDTLNQYAPDGYYFGTHPGDGSDYGYWKTETTDMQKIITIAETNGWSVHIAEVKNGHIQFEFSQFTPAGQDFNFSAEMTNNDTQTFIRSIKEYYDNFDIDEEAYLWIGEDGHGKNGAPYHIKDIIYDMEAAEEMVFQLYTALEEAI